MPDDKNIGWLQYIQGIEYEPVFREYSEIDICPAQLFDCTLEGLERKDCSALFGQFEKQYFFCLELSVGGTVASLPNLVKAG